MIADPVDSLGSPARAAVSRRSGFSLIEVMIVATVFVLIAMSIYGTLTSLTQLEGSTDSSVALQIEGQKGLNTILKELRTAGFYKPQTTQTLATYNTTLWTANVATDPHNAWDVPYLWAGEGAPSGVFAGISHPVATHKALSTDEEYHATREICFVPLKSVINNLSTLTPNATVKWATSGLGGAANIVLPIDWELISYELQTTPGEDYNRLRRIARNVGSGSLAIGAITSNTTLARWVEAVRFDSVQTDASLPLDTIKATIWLRKSTPSGMIVRAKVSGRVRLRNSV